MNEAAQERIVELMDGKREPDRHAMKVFVKMLDTEECRLRDFVAVGGIKLGHAVALAWWQDGFDMRMDK